MLKQIVLGILFILIGLVVVYYSFQLAGVIGRIARAEKNLWWTRNAIILFGFVVIVLWVLFMFGVLNTTSPIDTVTSKF